MSNYRNDSNHQYSKVFAALANPHRLAILDLLTGCCPGSVCGFDASHGCCVGELGGHLSIAPSTLSHHLKEMNRAGLIVMRRDGKQVYCRVNEGMLDELRNLFDRKESIQSIPTGDEHEPA